MFTAKKPKKSSKWMIALAVALPFALLASAHAQTLRKVSATIPALTESSAVFFIAKERGYWREEGLDVDLVVVRAALSIQAVISGNVDFSTAGGSALLPITRGLPLSFLFTTFNRPHFSLYVKPQIAALSDLRGKRVGVSSIGSGPDTLLRDHLKKQGMESGRDVTIMAVGTGVERFIALKSDIVDASMLSPTEHHLAEQSGYRELVSFVKQPDAVYLQGAVVTTEQRLKSDPLLIEKFLRGTLRGLIYLRDNRAGSVATLSRVLKIREEIMAPVYDKIRAGLTADGTVDEEQQRKALEPVLERLDAKGPPPAVSKVFNFAPARKIYAALEAKK